LTTIFKDIVMKCKCKKNCRKSASILSFTYQNIITERANMGGSKHVRRDERFPSLAQIDELYHELKWNMLMKRAHWAFYWPKYACINLA